MELSPLNPVQQPCFAISLSSKASLLWSSVTIDIAIAFLSVIGIDITVCHENHLHILVAVLPVLVIIVVVAVVSVISLPFSCFESEQKCHCC